MQLLTTVDADEVSPVRRGANRKRVVLKEDEEVRVEAQIADIMAVPWESEGTMVDALRKEDADETVIKAAVGAMRLLSGIADELPDDMREVVEKLGSEMYARTNPALNTSGVPSPGGLTGHGPSSETSPAAGSSSKQTELEAGGRDGELISRDASAPKVAADADGDDDCDMDEDGVAKDGTKPYGDVAYADPGYQSDGKKRYPIDTDEHVRAAWSYINKPGNAGKYSSGDLSKVKGKIRSAMKRIGAEIAKEDEVAFELETEGVEPGVIQRVLKAMGFGPKSAEPADEPAGGEPDTDDTDVSKGSVEKEDGTVETHAVPIQKEDGSWDLSAVPDSARPFYESMIAKADETAVKLEKAETELAETREALRTEQIIAKAETEFQKVGARDDVVAVLKEAGDKLSPEGYEALVGVLAGANEKIEKGDLFTEAGRSGFDGGEGGGDAWEKIEKAAAELVEKSDTSMTQAQAIDRVLKTAEGSALYSVYMRENGMGVS